MASAQRQQFVTFYTLHLSFGKHVFIKLKSLKDDHYVLNGTIGLTLPETNSASAGFQVAVQDNVIDIEWPGASKLQIVHSFVDSSAGFHRYDFKWTSYGVKELQDAYQLSGSHWYGAAQVRVQKWPIEKWQMKMAPFIAGDSFKDQQYGGVQERYFLSSAGIALFVDDAVPLWVAVNGNNDQFLRFASKFQSPYRNPNKRLPYLNYALFQCDNVKTVHEKVITSLIAHPAGIPNEKTFRHPIWSTWATYKKDIDQKKVLEFAKTISKYKFEMAQFEIDDDWTPAYGDMEFDAVKFPKAYEMMNELRSMGLRVTLWVHPFASLRSAAVGRGDFWIKSTWTRGVTTWWNGLGKCLDVTNPAAVAWYRGCLRKLADDYGIASFKFDAGELSWLPPYYSTHTEMSSPNEYARKYVEMCASIDRDLRALEVRVGVQTQHLPILVRMMDKESSWGDNNGLATLIPHALTFGILGYPFVLPDMVGGNAYQGLPDRELYIRWMQANALLPVIQISIPPWQYDDAVVEITRDMLKLHESYGDLFIKLAREATVSGAPIIRPLWWIAPEDENALAIDSQFMLGDDILVAPVLELGARSRLVYFPVGLWRHGKDLYDIEGPKWHKCAAELADLPYFICIKHGPQQQSPQSQQQKPQYVAAAAAAAEVDYQSVEAAAVGGGGDDDGMETVEIESEKLSDQSWEVVDAP